MQEISIYLQPIIEDEAYQDEQLGQSILKYTTDNFPDLSKKGVAIIHVPEYRKNQLHQFKYEKSELNFFRKEFYSLYKGQNWEHSIYDLGTILPGETIDDTYHAIIKVCEYLIKNEIIPFIIGGSQDLTLPMFNGYNDLEQSINVTSIDASLDIGSPDNVVSSNAWVSPLLMQQPNYLFNFSNIGAQKHYISNKEIALFKQLYFDILRLGEINNDITLAEPLLRNTDLLSVDLTSIRASEMQNDLYTSPNGFFANELCRVLRYGGISDKLTSVGIFNYYSNKNKTTDQLLAQLIWYFNEGYANRKNDFPLSSKKKYKKFRVFIEEIKEEIIFYKSNKSERWWIEVSFPQSDNPKFMRHHLVPCSYKTYQQSMRGDIPNLWWKTYQKLIN